MKKAVTTLLLFFAFTFILSIVYSLMLPERSEQLLHAKIADTSDAQYHRDELERFISVTDKKIADELNIIHQSELINLSIIQSAINEFGVNSKEAGNAAAMKDYQDSINLKKVTAIINKYGWPGVERIGAQNNYTLYTTIQNADLQTQQRFIPVMEQAVKKGALSPKLFAKLIDRKALAEHGFQIFGTHFKLEKNSKKIVFSLIKDEQTVNDRRKEIGLDPIDIANPAPGIGFVKSDDKI